MPLFNQLCSFLTLFKTPLTPRPLLNNVKRLQYCLRGASFIVNLHCRFYNASLSNDIEQKLQKKSRVYIHIQYIQGAFFYCSAQISVLKRKTLFNQQESFVHREFHGTESLIGCPSFFILVLKIGRNN